MRYGPPPAPRVWLRRCVPRFLPIPREELPDVLSAHPAIDLATLRIPCHEINASLSERKFSCKEGAATPPRRRGRLSNSSRLALFRNTEGFVFGFQSYFPYKWIPTYLKKSAQANIHTFL